jgi:hypothetical protein
VAATYASALAVCAASLLIGQAAVTVCGGRRWSWLAPGVGLALLCALCWATVRLPGDGTVSAVAVLVVALAALLYLRSPGMLEGSRAAVRAGLPVALLALVAASLPFLVEGRFGILGTSFNPDMSQHLLAADRLADGQTSSLLAQGYPLGPHAVVVALNKGLGVGLVQGFDGLTLAIAALAALTALGALSDLTPLRRTAGALLVALPYMVVSYYAQGAFKETMQALFILAFTIGLLELSSAGAWRPAAAPALRTLPLGLLAAGSIFVYSFPGLTWLVGTAVIWGALQLLWLPAGSRGDAFRAALLPAAVAVAAVVALGLPEIGRVADFGHFETFDPAGPGLGNLFGQISPAEALGIWPSGDFRLDPGDGAVPAIGYYAGVALGLALLAYGLVWALRRRESAIPAAFAAAVAIYAAARIGGTPYTAAKAVAMIAPPAMLLIARPLLALPRPDPEPTPGSVLLPLAAAAFLVGAAACSILALANGPVGPTSYTAALTELRPRIADGATVMLAPRTLLEDQHGVPYFAWELRGGRVCIEAEGEAGGSPPAGVRYVIAPRSQRPPYSDLRPLRNADGYRLWARSGRVAGASDCPLIAVRQARQGERQG